MRPVAVGVLSAKAEELSVKDFDLYLALYDFLRRAGQVLAAYREESPRVIHLDLSLAPFAARELGLDEDMDPGSRRRELCVRIQLLDELCGPVLDLTGLWVPALVQVQASVRIFCGEDEADTVVSMLLCGSYCLIVSAPSLGPVHGSQPSGVRADGHLGDLAVSLFISPIG